VKRSPYLGPTMLYDFRSRFFTGESRSRKPHQDGR
jgi:hypothetical protein